MAYIGSVGEYDLVKLGIDALFKKYFSDNSSREILRIKKEMNQLLQNFHTETIDIDVFNVSETEKKDHRVQVGDALVHLSNFLYHLTNIAKTVGFFEEHFRLLFTNVARIMMLWREVFLANAICFHSNIFDERRTPRETYVKLISAHIGLRLQSIGKNDDDMISTYCQPFEDLHKEFPWKGETFDKIVRDLFSK